MRALATLFLGLSLSGLALAEAEGGAVSQGPITALDKLQSIKAFKSTPDEASRHFNIQSWTTSNGAKVMFVRAEELPMLDVHLVFDAGSARDGGTPGLASMASRMMREGTPTRDTTGIAAAFENLGAEFSTSSYRDMALADLRVMTDPQFLKPAVDVFADVIAHAAYPDITFKRVYQSAEVGQQQQFQSPSAQASLLFFKNLYGSHPYATPTTGTPESIAKIKPEDLRAFHSRFYVAKNMVIAMVGDLSEDQARAVSEQISSVLPAGEHAPGLPAVAPLKKARQVHLAFPSQQTHLILGQPGITRDDPDYYPLVVGNEILGGAGFGSLLTQEIREKRGLTYGVSSGFTSMRAEGPFLISLSTRSDQADEALALTREVLKSFLDNGPTDRQVKDTVANLVGSFPLDTASNNNIVANLGMIGFYNLPLDYLDRYVTSVEAVTPEQIRKAFRRHVNPDKLLLITVGQKAPVWK